MTYENIAFGITRLLILAALVWMIRQRYFRIIVPSASMAPLIQPGDHILVRRLSGSLRLKHGNLIVFRSTAKQKGDGSLLMIKRLIGLPGDRIRLEEGRLWLNGQEQSEAYVKFFKKTEADFFVPSGSYLFLGDNRSASHDARYWTEPYVREREIAGQAFLILWPLSRVRILK